MSNVEMESRSSSSQASTLRRGMAILRELSIRSQWTTDGVGPSELARAVGCDKSQASRTLAVLCELGFVEKVDEGRGYRPTWSMYGLGVRGADLSLVSAGMAVLDALSAKVQLGCYLTVRNGNAIMPIWSAAQHYPHVTVHPGTRWSLHASAAGIAHLLDHSRSDLDEELGKVELTRFTPRTPQSLDEVWSLVLTAKRHGYAVQDRQWHDELFAVAAPIRGPFRGIVGAVAVSGRPTDLADRVDKVASYVLHAASAIGGRLAKDSGPPGEGSPFWVRRLD